MPLRILCPCVEQCYNSGTGQGPPEGPEEGSGCYNRLVARGLRGGLLPAGHQGGSGFETPQSLQNICTENSHKLTPPRPFCETREPTQHQGRGEDMEGAALQDKAPPPICPALPNQTTKWREKLVHNCIFGLLTLYYPGGFMGLSRRSPVIWDYAEPHQILNIHPIYKFSSTKSVK